MIESNQKTPTKRRPRALRLKKSPPPYEKHDQENWFAWVRFLKYQGESVGLYAVAIPNGAFLAGPIGRRAAQMESLKRQGLRKGYPDIVLDIAVAPFHGLRIEAKRIGAPKPPEDQASYHDRLRKQGYRVEVCYGFEAMKVVTLDYLGLSTHGVTT